MKDESPAEFNPYQAPAQPTIVEPKSRDDWSVGVERFKSESEALGIAMVGFGTVGLVIAVQSLRSGSAGPAGFGTISAVGGCLLAVCAIFVGIAIAMKNPGAIRAGLVVLYATPIVLAILIPSAAGAMIAFGFIGLALLIAQAHRVLGWAREMEAAGIPLTTRPEQLRAEKIARILREPKERT